MSAVQILLFLMLLPMTGASSVGQTLAVSPAPQSRQAKWTCEEIESFMRNAKIITRRGVSAVMDDGAIQHRVFVHTVDESRALVPNRDTWKANVAAYELTKMLEIRIMPPYVQTTVEGRPGSVSWGLDGVIMDEVQRTQRNVQPPDTEAWNRQMHVVRVFDELVYDGRAPSDLLITSDWRAWIIGPSQAFRPNKTIQNPGNLVKCDRKLLARMRTLDKDLLVIRLGKWLTGDEIDGLHARAAEIVQFFDRGIVAKGDASVLFDLDRSGSPCAF